MEWKEITTQEASEELLNLLGGFHDGCFREMHIWSGSYINEIGLKPAEEGLKAKMLFHIGGFNGIEAVELMFTDVQKINIVKISQGSIPVILDSTLKFEDGLFYWTDEAGWDIKNPRSHEILWIASKGLKWREKPGWLGKTLRYGIDD